MSWLLPFVVLLPFGGYLLSLLIPAHQKNLIFWWTLGVMGTHFLAAVAVVLHWLTHGFPPLTIGPFELYHIQEYVFSINFYLDKISLTYLLVGAMLTFLVISHSRYQLPERSYKRFFNTLLCFYLGYILVILAGNFVTMLIGWEFLALASFLLVAFYRERYLPAKNAVKVFSLYRLGDVGIILALWMSHQLGTGNEIFHTFATSATLPESFREYPLAGVFVSILIVGAAAVKSAQVPFSWWLPRAMESLPPAGAVLFGALSVHLGIFLLLRGVPFWENQFSAKCIMGLLGLCTSIMAALTARVQSSVQSRIAYSSIAQVGLIFIEVAAGFQTLALIHVVGNAMLRAYQVLYSPSRIAYLSTNPLLRRVSRSLAAENFLPRRMAVTLYMLSLKEWNLDSMMYQYLWNPVKWVGRKMDFLTVGRVVIFFVPGYLLGWWLLFNPDFIPRSLDGYLPFLFALFGLVLVVKAFTEQKSLWLGWLLVMLSHGWIALAIGFNEGFDIEPIYYELSGVGVAGGIGFLILGQLGKVETNLDLTQFHGHAYKHPKLALVFLLACLGLAGFTISPIYIGEDLLLTHIPERQAALAFMVSLCFSLHALTLMRIYALVFLGPHDKSMYERAYRAF